MRKTVLVFFIVSIVFVQVHKGMAIDLGGVINNVAGHVINNAMRGGSNRGYSQPQVRHYQQQPQTTQTYTYEEYMAMQNAASDDEYVSDSELPGEFTYEYEDASPETASAKAADDFDPDNPFAGLVDKEMEAPAANAGKDSGGKESDTIEVVATGIGQDSDSALKNALRAAIEQAVGTLVDSETLAENDEVVNDQILSYSAGFVESHKVIGEPKTRDGLVTIKIQAQVKRTQLTEKLQAANIHIKEVDGESLFGEVFTALEQEQNASELVKKKFEGFPENMLKIQLAGKPRYNQESKKIEIEVEISVDRDHYRSFTKDLVSLFSTFASSHQTVNQSVNVSGNGILVSGRFFNEAQNMVSICTQMNDARTNSKWEVFGMASEILGTIYTAFKRPVFTVDIVDADGDSIVSGRYDSPAPYFISPFFNKTGVFLLPLLDTYRGGGHADPGTVSGKWTVTFDVSTDEMKRMRNVVCKIEKGR